MHVVIDNPVQRVEMPESIKTFVVDSDGGRRTLVAELLRNLGYITAASCECVTDLETKISLATNQKYLLVLCVDSVTDAIILELKNFLAFGTMPVLLLVENINKAVVEQAMKAGVTAFLSLGVKGNRVEQAIDSAFANFSVVNDLQNQVSRLKNQLEDRIIIDKAKGLVMKNRGLDEQHAYSYLRDYSMRNGEKLIDVANMIIATAELLDK